MHFWISLCVCVCMCVCVCAGEWGITFGPGTGKLLTQSILVHSLSLSHTHTHTHTHRVPYLLAACRSHMSPLAYCARDRKCVCHKEMHTSVCDEEMHSLSGIFAKQHNAISKRMQRDDSSRIDVPHKEEFLRLKETVIGRIHTSWLDMELVVVVLHIYPTLSHASVSAESCESCESCES